MCYRSDGAERSCNKVARSTYSFYLFVYYLLSHQIKQLHVTEKLWHLHDKWPTKQFWFSWFQDLLYGLHICAWIWATNLMLLMAPCWCGSYFILHHFMYWVCGNDVHVGIMDASWVELVKLIHSWSHSNLLLSSLKGAFGLTTCKGETSLHREE